MSKFKNQFLFSLNFIVIVLLLIFNVNVLTLTILIDIYALNALIFYIGFKINQNV